MPPGNTPPGSPANPNQQTPPGQQPQGNQQTPPGNPENNAGPNRQANLNPNPELGNRPGSNPANDNQRPDQRDSGPPPNPNGPSLMDKAAENLNNALPEKVRQLANDATQSLVDRFGRENVDGALHKIVAIEVAVLSQAIPGAGLVKAAIEIKTGRDMLDNHVLTAAEKLDRIAQGIPFGVGSEYLLAKAQFEFLTGRSLLDPTKQLSVTEQLFAGVAVVGMAQPAANKVLSNGNTAFMNAAESSGANVTRALVQEEQQIASAAQQASRAEQQVAGAAQQASRTEQQIAGAAQQASRTEQQIAGTAQQATRTEQQIAAAAQQEQRAAGSAQQSSTPALPSGEANINLNAAPAGIQYKGTVYRMEDPSRVGTTFDVHPGNIAADHRYSGVGRGAVYGATSNETAMAEVQHYGAAAGRVSVSKEVTLNNVLDLTNPAVRQELNVTLEQINGNSYSITQRLGDLARAKGYDGILAPSARNPNGTNLVIFP